MDIRDGRHRMRRGGGATTAEERRLPASVRRNEERRRQRDVLHRANRRQEAATPAPAPAGPAPAPAPAAAPRPGELGGAGRLAEPRHWGVSLGRSLGVMSSVFYRAVWPRSFTVRRTYIHSLTCIHSIHS